MREGQLLRLLTAEIGASRLFAAVQQISRFQGKADIRPA
jgi:hypothetical protein